MSDFLLDSALQCQCHVMKNILSNFCSATNKSHYQQTTLHTRTSVTLTMATSDYSADHDFYRLFFRQNIFVPLRDMTVNYSQDFVTIARCKDMVAFVTYCLYLKQFCKMP